jgi:hypothetical protein
MELENLAWNRVLRHAAENFETTKMRDSSAIDSDRLATPRATGT